MPNHKNKKAKGEKSVASEGGRTGKVKQEFTTLVDTVDKRITELEEKEARWAALEASMEEHASKVSDKITLDIGMLQYAFLL
jgi:hypothetical protein